MGSENGQRPAKSANKKPILVPFFLPKIAQQKVQYSANIAQYSANRANLCCIVFLMVFSSLKLTVSGAVAVPGF